MPNPTQKCDAQFLFAANMRRIRKEKELTQEKVAELAGLHPNYVSSVERGERNISICNIERIARALGVAMVDLVAVPPRAIPASRRVASTEPGSKPDAAADAAEAAPDASPAAPDTPATGSTPS